MTIPDGTARRMKRHTHVEIHASHEKFGHDHSDSAHAGHVHDHAEHAEHASHADSSPEGTYFIHISFDILHQFQCDISYIDRKGIY